MISRLRRGRDDSSDGPPAGLHAYRRSLDGGSARLHLRIDSDGNGLLLVNADRAVHLNATAALMAWLQLEGQAEKQALSVLRRRFHAPLGQLRRDYLAVQQQIDELSRPDGACPIHDLDLDILPPFSSVPDAPYRMDLALTYRCNNECAHCYNARPRAYPEIKTDDWRRLIDRLWQVGVPHICFTGGEATLRTDLPHLIAHAEANGQITGLLTNGRRLSDRGYVEALKAAGLDHVQVTIESHVPEIHDRMVACQGAWQQTVTGIRNVLEAGLFVMTNTTLLAENCRHLAGTLAFLADLGVPTVGFNALIHAGKGAASSSGIPETDLSPLLTLARQQTAARGQRLIWYTPTQYCSLDPVQMELGVKGCSAALYNMCVEPDGGVIPCQSYYQQVGNLLHDPWDSIWNHPLCRWLRERRYVPESCHQCALLPECGGGCPLALEGVAATSPMDAQLIVEEG